MASPNPSPRDARVRSSFEIPKSSGMVEEDKTQEPPSKISTLHGELGKLNIVVLGASGDLAKKKTYPAIFGLYKRGLLPADLHVFGYARSALTDESLREQLRKFLKGDSALIEGFLSVCTYIQGQYDQPDGYNNVHAALSASEGGERVPGTIAGRLYYLALPPSVYPDVCKQLKDCCSVPPNPTTWVRNIIEKPFGKDLETSEVLAEQLGALFPEEQLYRIDHYLGKEMTQNMLLMRFSNIFLYPLWNAQFIKSVQITFKENFGTDGRGGYFDGFGIIRDVIQNHLLQVMALFAMEKPLSLSPDDIRDEKTRVLRCCEVLTPDDVVIGQYVTDGKNPGYLEDPTVPKGSRQATFATCVLRVNNDRWAGVPFILKAGKALNERKCEVRVQFHAPPNNIFGGNLARNELVMRLQPDEALYMKINMKMPGLQMAATESELDLSYKSRYEGVYIPDAYERLILDAVRGDQQHFVRRDELHAAWTIFTPLLHAVDRGDIEPVSYVYGSRGPKESDDLIQRNGYERSSNYVWHNSAGLAPSGSDPALASTVKSHPCV
mmetsp:Transcript_35892/g.113520  ORF Transcript_35892/g.113520 Transcript_35892/m.113520 type:complete len:551 (-) Transcript_35892:1095-2747(-)|eukprot:CAMPEP_0182883266 /NCGR_PEP_ID=MMETSP0034_2-20130328/18280_1 /TAXON_ID=156128 /ORGANISM="Nephroselmis pyriformis, Strain CCMP717" /LENGTH=550 /DNA_ID=CAMNT_0025016403 /DNA_START=61 /DNA_END=1713 /DNA_ORIENTATION=+